MEGINLFQISLVFLIGMSEHIVQILSLDTYNDISSWKQCLPNGKVVGGEPISVKEAPFILVLEEMKGYPPEFHVDCGASILSKNIALTAAHCTHSKPLNILRLRSGTSIAEKGKIHYIRKVVDHELYAEARKDNDIALIFLKNPFIFSSTVQPIKLPTKELKAGTLVMVAGYGDTHVVGVKRAIYNESDLTPLKRATVPIVDRVICNAVMKEKQKEMNYPPEKKISITETMICAGYPGGKIDTCQGDSGGPLYYKKTLYGVVSWGYGCALPCSPGVYANVYKYLDWIKRTIKENSKN